MFFFFFLSFIKKNNAHSDNTTDRSITMAAVVPRASPRALLLLEDKFEDTISVVLWVAVSCKFSEANVTIKQQQQDNKAQVSTTKESGL